MDYDFWLMGVIADDGHLSLEGAIQSIEIRLDGDFSLLSGRDVRIETRQVEASGIFN
jgi:hypothetical protein